MKTGKGTLRLAPIMMWEDGSIVITELPGSKNTDSVYKILEKEFTSDKLDIRDESTSITRIVIEKVPYKQVDMEEVYSRLYNKLQVNEICNMAFFDQNHIYVPCSFDKVVKANLQYLINTHQNRITHQLEDLKLKLEVLEIIEKIKCSGSVKELVDFDTTGAIEYISVNYNTTKDIASKVLQKSLSYLTKAHFEEIQCLRDQILELENDSKDVYEFLIKKYRNLKKEVSKNI